ncbi:hypothetical protein D7B24_009095 [Verticillium nonalfalfae]|uniref:mRNA export factor GLE1 n=1 Tax=Verticillium nonalfalfae TaxID=1051616 RepID=A0A3M9Y3W8_9PEZI|nr:uncharacterized protein D7B24_009095 [Verticillium nonalfalfae]RNJ54994.1 hypothetical protein D7B24_009095 [Verticillium nonalfalfae]
MAARGSPSPAAAADAAAKRNYGSPIRSSPERHSFSDYLNEDRNSEVSHREALENARLEHERVRLNALRIGKLHQLQEEQRRAEDDRRRIAEEAQRLRALQLREQERLKEEERVRAEQQKLRDLQAQKVPELPPQPKPQPPPAAKPQAAPAVNGADAAVKKEESPAATTQPAPTTTPQTGLLKTPSPFAPVQKPAQTTPAPAATPQLNGARATAAAPAATANQAAPAVAALPTSDRYAQIHQELKKLRKELDKQSKVVGSPLKGKLGDMRRQARKAMGQLTAGKGANARPINTIVATLKESLDGSVPSYLVDGSIFVADSRDPVEGAVHNGPQLPAVFIYLLSHLSKAMIHQFASEVGANPKSAEPIGIVAAHLFSNPDFHWRGKPMIDILIAKFRVACPVLFGARGNDRTEAGRIAVGWRREDGRWISEQAHSDRMTGLGAGFASISLRDFSKASKKNPYPPSHYWTAMAKIVNSPPALISNTQYTVLKAMIDGHETRFLQFYGNAAIEALRTALVEFPKKAPATSHTAQALQVLGQVLQRDSGLALA